jgi:uncharacterized protein (TIGR02147 family)
MENTSVAPSIYDFLDVAQYLQAYYDGRKSQDKSFTYTAWALELNIGSKTILRFILKRRRNISKKTALVLCANLKLQKNEAEYFFNLVAYSQAKTGSERKLFGDALLKAQRVQYQQYPIEAPLAVKSVYGPILLTLLTFKDIPKTAQHLGLLLNVEAHVIQEVLTDLNQNGLVSSNAAGEYSYTYGNVKVPDSPGNENLLKFYEYWIDQAKHSLRHQPKETRKFRSLKFALSADEFQDIQERLNEFALTLLSRYHNDNMEERRLYMLNTALFPLTNYLESTLDASTSTKNPDLLNFHFLD